MLRAVSEFTARNFDRGDKFMDVGRKSFFFILMKTLFSGIFFVLLKNPEKNHTPDKNNATNFNNA